MSNIKAEVITIGDEILYGQINDTNSQWISGELDNVGIKTVRKTTVADSEEDIMAILKEAEARADILLLTGGLGPTKDDLTKPTLAKYFNTPLEINEEALNIIESFFKQIGREITQLNRNQAMLPKSCDMIPNKLGTAPGMWFEKNGQVVVSMPGVPYEMKEMMLNYIIPRLQKTFKTAIIYHKIIKTIGIGESWLADIIKEWEALLPEHIKLAYLPSIGQVRLRLTAAGQSLDQLEAEVNEQAQKVYPLIKKYVYGYDNDRIEEVIGQMLLNKGFTVSTAESCTGGYIAHLITSIAGSSKYYKGSIVAYDNSIKKRHLNVEAQILEEHGAVSEPTVLQMAKSIREKLDSDIGIATSGIAGPSGGSESKPVGTLWIAYADSEKAVARKLQFGKNREVNIKLTAVSALDLLRRQLNKLN